MRVGEMRNQSPEKLAQRGSLASRGRGRPEGQSQGRRGAKNHGSGEEKKPEKEIQGNTTEERGT